MRIGLERDTVPTRSELEDRFLSLCQRHRLPRPEVNVQIGSYEVDFLWRAQRLVADTDGYRYHRGDGLAGTGRTRCEWSPGTPPNVLRFSPEGNRGQSQAIQRASE